METKNILWANIAVFSLVGVVHLCRTIFDWTFVVGSWAVPRWLSGVAVAILGVLVWYNWKATQ